MIFLLKITTLGGIVGYKNIVAEVCGAEAVVPKISEVSLSFVADTLL